MKMKKILASLLMGVMTISLVLVVAQKLQTAQHDLLRFIR